MSDTPPDFDARFFRTALGRFATGVTIVTTAAPDGAPIGLTVSSFNSVSLDPPLVLWSLSRGSASLEVFEHCERYVVNVLSAGQVALARRFALGHSRERFNGLPRAQAPGGRSEEHTSELQSLMRISYAVFCLKKKESYNLCLYCFISHTCTKLTQSQ